MKHLVVVGALLLSTVGSFAGEVRGRIVVDVCYGATEKASVTEFPDYFTIGSAFNGTQLCIFDKNSSAGKMILKKCALGKYCKINVEGRIPQALDDLLIIQKVISISRNLTVD